MGNIRGKGLPSEGKAGPQMKAIARASNLVAYSIRVGRRFPIEVERASLRRQFLPLVAIVQTRPVCVIGRMT